MYIITSNTSNDIPIDVVKNGKSNKVHLTKKFQVVESEEINDKIIYLDSKGIIKYAKVENKPDNKSDNRNSNKRGRQNQNQAPDKNEGTVTDESDSKSDKPDETNNKSKEGGN